MGKNGGQAKWWLIILLAILILVIIGLGTFLIFKAVQDAEDSKKDDQEITSEILDTIEPMDVAEAQKYLEKQVRRYGKRDLDDDIQMMQFYSYVNAGEYNNAIEMYPEIDESSLSDYQKQELYSALYHTYNEVGDKDKANYYAEKFAELYYRILGGDTNDV